MNIIESVIVAAARELVNSYLQWCAADESFDAGEFSGRVERIVPEEVMAAVNFLETLEGDDC